MKESRKQTYKVSFKAPHSDYFCLQTDDNLIISEIRKRLSSSIWLSDFLNFLAETSSRRVLVHKEKYVIIFLLPFSNLATERRCQHEQPHQFFAVGRSKHSRLLYLQVAWSTRQGQVSTKRTPEGRLFPRGSFLRVSLQNLTSFLAIIIILFFWVISQAYRRNLHGAHTCVAKASLLLISGRADFSGKTCQVSRRRASGIYVEIKYRTAVQLTQKAAVPLFFLFSAVSRTFLQKYCVYTLCMCMLFSSFSHWLFSPPLRMLCITITLYNIA